MTSVLQISDDFSSSLMQARWRPEGQLSYPSYRTIVPTRYRDRDVGRDVVALFKFVVSFFDVGGPPSRSDANGYLEILISGNKNVTQDTIPYYRSDYGLVTCNL